MNSLGVSNLQTKERDMVQIIIDGNNILEVYSSVTKLKKEISENQN